MADVAATKDGVGAYILERLDNLEDFLRLGSGHRSLSAVPQPAAEEFLEPPFTHLTVNGNDLDIARFVREVAIANKTSFDLSAGQNGNTVVRFATAVHFRRLAARFNVDVVEAITETTPRK